jgi:hypothetical protein
VIKILKFLKIKEEKTIHVVKKKSTEQEITTKSYST